MHKLSIVQQIHGLQNKEFSSSELVAHYLQRIETNKNLNAFISINTEKAISSAKAADKALATGNAPLLCGIPMAHKDIFCTTDLPTTCASRMLENYTSPYNATVVSKLVDSGTIMLGKTNMDEFAMGSTGETSYFGVTRNPWNTNQVAGGSSSGSAAAVAARIAPFATTTDTGGSTRQPAAFCGLSGIKPTYGLISRYGQIAYASSFDQAGVVTTNVPDLALTTQVIAGFDKNDSTSINKPVADLCADLDKPIKSFKIGFPKCILSIDIDAEVKQSILDTLEILKSEGADIIEVDLELMDLWLPCYQTLTCAEVSSNLSRFDGIRFGHQTKSASNVEELITKSRTEAFGIEAKKRILTGTFILSDSHDENYYLHAQKVRQLITNELKAILSKVDTLILPTTASEAFKIGDYQKFSKKHKLADMFTTSANLSGMPAVAIPSGFGQNNLPIGIQFLGNYFSEPKLLQIANTYQKLTNWHTKIPSLGE